jgi:molybdopterin-binding protein
MAVNGQLLKPREAARLLGMSFAAIKHWILNGKIATIKTPGGHHRVPLASLTPYLNGWATRGTRPREKCQSFSGSNRLPGKIVSIRPAGLVAEVVLAIGEWQVTAIITAEAVTDMQLHEGDSAAALIKSTQVMIERLDDGQDASLLKDHRYN